MNSEIKNKLDAESDSHDDELSTGIRIRTI